MILSKQALSLSILSFFCATIFYCCHANDLADVGETEKSELKTVADNSSTAVAYTAIVAKVNSIVQEIKSHNYPNEEEKAHAYQVAEQYALLTAENELEKCIIKNKDTFDRMDSGLPSICRELAQMLLVYGGKKELDRMTTNY